METPKRNDGDAGSKVRSAEFLGAARRTAIGRKPPDEPAFHPRPRAQARKAPTSGQAPRHRATAAALRLSTTPRERSGDGCAPYTRHMHDVFVTGGTGYIGSRLIAALAARGHRVRALARSGSVERLPPGCEPIVGDALDAASYAADVPPADTFVQLVGVPHPSPAKAAQFRSIDLPSALAGMSAASQAGVRHFVYVSVAQPAPVCARTSLPEQRPRRRSARAASTPRSSGRGTCSARATGGRTRSCPDIGSPKLSRRPVSSRAGSASSPSRKWSACSCGRSRIPRQA